MCSHYILCAKLSDSSDLSVVKVLMVHVDESGRADEISSMQGFRPWPEKHLFKLAQPEDSLERIIGCHSFGRLKSAPLIHIERTHATAHWD